jgi:hypothetical protein
MAKQISLVWENEEAFLTSVHVENTLREEIYHTD